MDALAAVRLLFIYWERYETSAGTFAVATWGSPALVSSSCTPPPRTSGCWSWLGRWRRTRRGQRERYGSSVAPWTSWSAPGPLCPIAAAGFSGGRRGGGSHPQAGKDGREVERDEMVRKRKQTANTGKQIVLKCSWKKKKKKTTHGHGATH